MAEKGPFTASAWNSFFSVSGIRISGQDLSGATGEPDGRTENGRMFVNTMKEAASRSCLTICKLCSGSDIKERPPHSAWVCCSPGECQYPWADFSYSLSFPGTKHVI